MQRRDSPRKKINKKGIDPASMLAYSAIFLLLTLLILYSVEKSTFFTSIPIDGAFQHLNPLRRIAAGEVPGRDFQVFHGLATSYFHYPIYALFGKTLFASELSRYVLNGVSALAATAALFVGLRQRFATVFLTVTFVLSAKVLGLFWLTDPFGDAYSSLAVRTLVPALAFGYLLYLCRAGKIGARERMGRVVAPEGVLCAISMVIATEQGLALIVAMSVALMLVYPERMGVWGRLRDLLVFLGLAVAVYLFLVVAITRGAPGQALSFYFKDLPSDQFWYFGSYPNIFPKDLLSLFIVPGTSRPFNAYLIVGIAVAVISYGLLKSRDASQLNEYKVWAAALIYGGVALISNLGMISSHYAEAIVRISYAIILISCWRFVEWRTSVRIKSRIMEASLLASLVFISLSNWRFPGIMPTALDFSREHWHTRLEKQYSQVFPRAFEYRRLFSIAATAIPPKPLLRNGEASQTAVEARSGGLLALENAPPALADYLDQGTDIEINGRLEKVMQVSPLHLLFTASGSDQTYRFRYRKPNTNPITLSTTPYYSRLRNVWLNGVTTVGTEGGGCLMVPQEFQLVGVDEFRVLKFADETDERHVTSVYRNVVCVDGPPLEPYLHGFPQRFTILPAVDFSTELIDEMAKYANGKPAGLAELAFKLESYKKNEKVKVGGRKIESFDDDDDKDVDYSASPTATKTNKQPRFLRLKQRLCGEEGELPTLWSTYTGFLELEEGIVNPSGADYIIHALGDNRRSAYLKSFIDIKPTFVHTLRPSYTPYERWIQTSSWEFYELLLANYEPVRKTEYSLIWRRRLKRPLEGVWVDNPDRLCSGNYQPWVGRESRWDGEISPEGDAKFINLKELATSERAEPQIYVLELSYKMANRFNHIPVLGTSSRYFVKPIGTDTPLPISLPPYHDTISFPIVVLPGRVPALKLEVAAVLGGADFSITRIRFRKVKDYVASYRAALLDS